MVLREAYLNQLISLRNQKIIKVITGIRRCGKSTLMSEYQLWLQSNGIDDSHILAINFEERESSRFTIWQDVYDYIVARLAGDGMRYVFLDEVQTLHNFEKLVDALYVTKNIDLYITGSNAYLL